METPQKRPQLSIVMPVIKKGTQIKTMPENTPSVFVQKNPGPENNSQSDLENHPE